MRKLLTYLTGLGAVVYLIMAAGCSEGLYTVESGNNRAPEMWLSSGPVEGDTTGCHVRFYWSGWDPDGEISHFEFCLVQGTDFGIGFDPADTSGADKWRRTTSNDTIFRVTADENPRPYDPENPNSVLTRYDKAYILFMKAVDLTGKASAVHSRSFTAWTISPYCRITAPPVSYKRYGNIVTFRWEARDPIDSPENFQDPEWIRYCITEVIDRTGGYSPTFDIIGDMNADPAHYESLWTDWIAYDAPGDSGRAARIGDDEILVLGHEHVFFLQAMDDAGAVTAHFENNINAKQYMVVPIPPMILTVRESYLGTFSFLGTQASAAHRSLPPGVPLNFSWFSAAEGIGGVITGYRYGWNIPDLGDPDQWDCDWSPDILSAEEKILDAGINTFYVQVRDDGGRITMGRIEIEIIRFSMERALLMVDDFPSTDDPNPTRTMPTETEDDAFWLDICDRAAGFDPARDVYDVLEQGGAIPPIETVGEYANIIWNYSSGTTNAWKQLIGFTPESQAGQSAVQTVNYIPLFLARGGHLLTNGRVSGVGGGLADAFPEGTLMPASFRHDMTGVGMDTSGVNSMPYRDYCVTVADKVSANFLTGEDMPPGVVRSLDRDAMRYAYKSTDPVVIGHLAGFPERLDLWSGVTCPSCFFYPPTRGFTYVELYDVQYYMDFKQLTSQGCFHPVYRNFARNTLSPVHNQPVALVLTRYGDLFQGREDIDFVPAYSFHFGFPLWFFDRGQVDQIMSVVFDEWGIETVDE